MYNRTPIHHPDPDPWCELRHGCRPGHGHVRLGGLSTPRVLHPRVPHLCAARLTGHHFWFTAGPAVLGLVIHMVTGAAYGLVFILIAQRLRRSLALTAVVICCFTVCVVSSFVGLPFAAKLTRAGRVITNMAKMVGLSTLAVEHLMFGIVSGLLTFDQCRSSSTEPQVELRSPVAA